MLRSLHVRNYVLIDSLEIDFPEGLVIITGQTGAGSPSSWAPWASPSAARPTPPWWERTGKPASWKRSFPWTGTHPYGR